MRRAACHGQPTRWGPSALGQEVQEALHVAGRLPRANQRAALLTLWLPLPVPIQDLAHTLRTRLAGLPRFAAPKRAQHAFAVEHYAGEVVYSTEHLMDKNKVCSAGPVRCRPSPRGRDCQRLQLGGQLWAPPAGPCWTSLRLLPPPTTACCFWFMHLPPLPPLPRTLWWPSTPTCWAAAA